MTEIPTTGTLPKFPARNAALFAAAAIAGYAALSPWFAYGVERLIALAPPLWLLFLLLFLPAQRRRNLICYAVMGAASVGFGILSCRSLQLRGSIAPADWIFCIFAYWHMGCLAHAISTALEWALARGRPPASRGRIAALSAVRLAVLGAFLLPYAVACLYVIRLPYEVHGLPQAPFERVSFQSRDGLKLAGWLLPAERPDATAVIVLHGLGEDRSLYREKAEWLRRSGFAVLLFDFRAHGESQGHICTIGTHETLDVQGAVDFLKSRGFARIAGYGHSMGGAALVAAAAHCPDLKTLVVEGSFADLRSMAGREIPSHNPLASLLRRAAFLMTRAMLGGANLEAFSPADVARSLSGRRALFIHSAEDSVVPIDQGRKLAEAFSGQKTVLVFPHGGHLRAWNDYGAEYRAAVRKALGETP